MKHNIGSKPALYPTPLIVVGAMNGDAPTWTLVAHIGIPDHAHLMISLAKPHFINHLVRENETFSINVVDESWLKAADRCGAVSGHKQSKADFFSWTAADSGAPLIDDAKLSFELKVEDIYEFGNFENFICSIVGTYAEDDILNDKGKVDFGLFRPVLFEMPNYTYLSTGDKIGDCLKLQ